MFGVGVRSSNPVERCLTTSCILLVVLPVKLYTTAALEVWGRFHYKRDERLKGADETLFHLVLKVGVYICRRLQFVYVL